MVFENGRWITEAQDSSVLQQEIEQLKRDLRQLSQERNLLEYKNELLIDMLAVSSLDVKHYEEIERQLKTKIKSMSGR